MFVYHHEQHASVVESSDFGLSITTSTSIAIVLHFYFIDVRVKSFLQENINHFVTIIS